MKYFIGLTLLALVAVALADLPKLSEEQKAKAKAAMDECITQEKVSPEDAAKIRNKDVSNPSQTMKCFANCFFEKIGALKDGVLQEPVVLQQMTGFIGEDKAKAVIGKCAAIKGADHCDTAVKMYQCFESAKKEVA